MLWKESLRGFSRMFCPLHARGLCSYVPDGIAEQGRVSVCQWILSIQNFIDFIQYKFEH